MSSKSTNTKLNRNMNNNWRKCKHCGKFLSFEQMEKQTDVMFVFIPDTQFTIEKTYYVHRKCW
jgi:acetyl-CoA carboxylase beta subunit